MATRASAPDTVGSPPADKLRIRMYRVGFGDCFLVSIPMRPDHTEGDRPTHAHMLIDCGVHSSGDINTIEAAVDDIMKITGGKLAVVIATHAHRDHISGFGQFAAKFARCDIGHVWLPWTWDPHDRRAVKLQKKHSALTSQLTSHFNALGARATSDAAAVVQNLNGNDAAIALLNDGFGVGANVRYVRAGDRLTKPRDTGIPGLTVRFLGPPQSEEFLAQIDPPAGQRYLSGTNGGNSEWRNVLRPVPDRWRVPRSDRSLARLKLDAEDERALREQVASLEQLAFAIDQARNNESVVALLMFRGEYLLFPGDAQYGNWRWWLENAQPDEILPRIRFLKVAHHGSLNATPKSALEQMSEGAFAAMVSTQSVPWASIPREPLMTRLDQRTRKKIVRSDWLHVKGAPVPSRGATPPRPKRWPRGFAAGSLWIDYLL